MAEAYQAIAVQRLQSYQSHTDVESWSSAAQEMTGRGPSQQDQLTSTRRAVVQAGDCLRGLVSQMWGLRAQLRRQQDQHHITDQAPALSTIWATWRTVTRLQVINRELRRQARWRKTAKVAEAVASQNIHQAVKQFAPKQLKHRLQLRTSDGHTQSHEAERQQICKYYRDLCNDTPRGAPILSASVEVRPEEVREALRRIKAANHALHQRSICSMETSQYRGRAGTDPAVPPTPADRCHISAGDLELFGTGPAS